MGQKGPLMGSAVPPAAPLAGALYQNEPMKYLIVNADEFGASRGVNCGIFEAHRRGIVTSASLLVNTRWSEAAAEMSRALPELSVGLHADLTRDLQAGASESRLREGLEAQLKCFEQLMGCLPTHLDSRNNAHRAPQALPAFLDFAREYHLPFRDHCSVRYFSGFYGQYRGQARFDQISVHNLVRLLRTEIGEGITELSCHPGFFDANLASEYNREREAELQTLCAAPVRVLLQQESIELISYHEIGKFLVSVPV